MTNQNDWHIDKRLSISHFLSTIALAGIVFGYAQTQDTRITRLEERSVTQEQRLDRQIDRTANDMTLIRLSIERMEDRLERYMGRDK